MPGPSLARALEKGVHATPDASAAAHSANLRRALLMAAFCLLAAGPDHAQRDELLATAVHEAFAQDRRVDAQQVRVEAKDGAVRLLGEVDTDRERQAAEVVARRVHGVRRVENLLSVARRLAPGPGDSPIPERVE